MNEPTDPHRREALRAVVAGVGSLPVVAASLIDTAPAQAATPVSSGADLGQILAEPGGASRIGGAQRGANAVPTNLLIKTFRQWDSADFPSINIALTRLWESEEKGGLLVLPGRHRLSEPIVMRQGVTMFGRGHATRLEFDRCDGITFPFHQGFGMSEVADLIVTGSERDDDAHAAFFQEGTGRAADQLMGVALRNVAAYGFRRGASFRNVHNLYFERIWFQNVSRGIELLGSCFNVNMLFPNIIRGTAPGAWAESVHEVGIVTGNHDFGTNGGLLRPEHVSAFAPRIHGFATGLDFDAVVFAAMTGFDLQATECGISWGTASSGLFLQSGYVELASPKARSGMLGRDNSVPIASNIVLRDTHLVATGGTRCAGIRVGTVGGAGRQDNVTIENCSFEGMTDADIAIVNSGNIAIRNNKCRSERVAASISLSGIPEGRPVKVDQNQCAAPIVFDQDDWRTRRIIFGINNEHGRETDRRDPWTDQDSRAIKIAWTKSGQANSQAAPPAARATVAHQLHGESVTLSIAAILADDMFSGDGDTLRLSLSTALPLSHDSHPIVASFIEHGKAVALSITLSAGGDGVALTRLDAAATSIAAGPRRVDCTIVYRRAPMR